MLRAEGSQAWKKAKEDNDFPHFQPVLEKLLDYNLRYIELFKPYDHPYDVLLDTYEPEMKTADVKEIFSTIRPQQVELIEKIAAQPQLDDSVLHQFFEADKQLAAGREVTAKFGYDWQRGRQDAVTHPFATNLGYGDQRITYTVDENYLNSYLFAIFHEAGHAMYEQGVSKHLYRTSVYGGTSLAIHESQSRLWENLVGRSKPFWEYYFPKLQELFPSQLENTTLDDFYKAMNKVEPSLIRIEADEATYNLHVMLRLEIEMELIEGKLAVKDLPDAWNSRTEEYLGLTPPNDSQGVLQDVHWSMGYMGYFSTYALGNLVSAQLWEKIYETYPDMDDQIRSGDFSNLFNWLNEQIYQHGSKFEPQELVERITGSKITGEPYIKYLNDKFGELYGV